MGTPLVIAGYGLDPNSPCNGDIGLSIGGQTIAERAHLRGLRIATVQVRCNACLCILVHPYGDTDAQYVHWTDPIPGDPKGRSWIDVSTRNTGNGRLIVPRDWK